MCYSAQLQQDLKKLTDQFRAKVDVMAFEKLFQSRAEDDRVSIPKALEANFLRDPAIGTLRTRELIAAFQATQIREHEEAVFTQKKRLADAERKLQAKETKAALESQRIATKKVNWHLKKLSELKRTTPEEKDSRIFPFWYAPVIIQEGNDRVIRPMRYHCRPAGKPAFYDQKYSGCYNARRDNLEGFWKGQFGHSHGLIVVTSFYENVSRHAYEGRELAPGEKEENIVLHFNPKTGQDMVVACLWSHWEEDGQPGLDSFAAITDEPPVEVRAAGHDRCIVPIKASQFDDWLNPAGKSAQELHAILEDRERPYYENRLAA